MGTRTRKWDAEALPSISRIIKHRKPLGPHCGTHGRLSNGGNHVKILSCTSWDKDESVR
jgi:hypothetical protein